MRGVLGVMAVLLVACGQPKDGNHAQTELKSETSVLTCSANGECPAGERCFVYLLSSGNRSLCAPNNNACAPVSCPESGTQCAVLPDTGHVACFDIELPLSDT